MMRTPASSLLSLCSMLVLSASSAAPNTLARTPPMGWMSWQRFRAAVNCSLAGNMCINEELYKETAAALVSGGYAAAGYASVHLDDAILDVTGRDPATNQLRPDPARFPSGFGALGDYFHGLNLSFGFYSASSTTTCGGYPGSRGYEGLDAATMAGWGVDYLKLDGCGDPTYYPTGYAAMGAALQTTNRSIVYSCSWPAYLGDDESVKPFSTMIGDGCNLWRNFIDMGPTVGYAFGILEHFGNYSDVLSEWAGPGHWHDPDQLLVGNDAIPDDAARSQFALYAILAAPLILGTDMRQMKPSHRDILLNPDAIAINQDPLGKMGVRLGGAAASNAPQQVWYRPLANGDVAVALYNPGQPSSHPWHTACDANDENVTSNGYFAPSTQPQSWCFAAGAFDQSLFDWYCCNDPFCAGYNYSTVTGAGCLFVDAAGGWVDAPGVSGYYKKDFVAPTGDPAAMSLDFASVGLFPGYPVTVYDVWQRQVVAVTNATSWNATVPWLGTALYRLSQ